MIFTILRLLTHSELGMFHAYRRDGREGSKQRAINFDWDVVDRVFPSAKDSDRIFINCRCFEDATNVIQVEQWLKKQEKNWRFEGNCPKSDDFKFVEPDVLFAMVVDSSSSPANATWIVIPKDHPAREAILNHGESSGLGKARKGMIALYGDEGHFTRRTLAAHYPELFPAVDDFVPSEHNRGLEPDPVGLFDIMARAGHRLTSAVADLVDNSLSAGATEITITFPNPNQGGRWMCIRDNGKGMSEDELHHAMRIGSRRQYDGNELGKFGYGLKGASWSQADCLTVVTKAAGENLVHMTWDRDHLARTRTWNVLKDPIDEVYSEVVSIPATGTAVLLTRMRPPVEVQALKGVEPYVQEVTSLREHLELVFHRYLEGRVKGREKVAIKLNGQTLVPNNPVGHPLTKSHDPRTLSLFENDPDKKAEIVIRAHIVPTESDLEAFHAEEGPEVIRDIRDKMSFNGRWTESQGFFFYRVDRLIKWGGWEDIFSRDEKTKLLRLVVDFDRKSDDALQVDISKQLVRLPPKVTDCIKEVVKGPRAEARIAYGKGKKLYSSKGASGSPNEAIKEAGNKPSKGEKSGKFNPPAGQPKTKGLPVSIRQVENGDLAWVRKKGFNGEQLEITPRIPELNDLVSAIDSNVAALIALSNFLRRLEQADVVKVFNDD